MDEIMEEAEAKCDKCGQLTKISTFGIDGSQNPPQRLCSKCYTLRCEELKGQFQKGSIIKTNLLFGDIPYEKLKEICSHILPPIEQICKNESAEYDMLGTVQYGSIVFNKTQKKGRIILIDFIFKPIANSELERISAILTLHFIELCENECSSFIRVADTIFGEIEIQKHYTLGSSK